MEIKRHLSVLSQQETRDPVQDYADSNAVLRKLNDRIQNARYGNDRGGMVPPTELAQLRSDIANALATLEQLA
jgi:hypothetical protein